MREHKPWWEVHETAREVQEALTCEVCKGEVMEQHDIGWAVKQLQHGSPVRRAGWNGKGQYLLLKVPNENSDMTLAYVYIRTVDGDMVPWVCSQTDLLWADWEAV